MRFSFKSRQQHVPWPAVRDLWQAGDELPVFSAAWLFDHFYPIFSDDTGPCFEGWTLLTALSQQTARLRVGMMVCGNTYRHPAVLANMAATLDVICAGRLELGLGAGWNDQEHHAYGIALRPIRERMDRLAEACEVVHLLLTEPSATFRGSHYCLTEARCEPKPLQQPRPPLVIGGRGERRTLRIAARWADQWNFPGGTPEEFAHKLAVLHRHLDQMGRDRQAVEPSVQIDARQSPEVVAATARSMAAVGAQHVICNLPPEATPASLAALAAALEEEHLA